MRRILLAGTLGAVALILWAFLTNAVFGFSGRVELQRLPSERAVHEVLRRSIGAPGVYIVNPPLPADASPPRGPVYGIRYSGIGHDSAGRMFPVELAVTWTATTLAAALLSLASWRVRRRYERRALFIMGLGLLLAVAGDVPKLGIGGYPVIAALLVAGNRAAAWTVAALVMAWAIATPAIIAGRARSPRPGRPNVA